MDPTGPGAGEAEAGEPAPVAPAPGAQPPHFADGAARALEPAWIAVERTTGLIVTGVIALGLLGGFGVLILSGEVHAALLAILGAAVLALAATLLAFAALWPRWEYARAGYRIRPDRIETWRGLVWRRATSVPISRVQYTDVKQGPLMRRHKIATLVVHTAGTLGAEVELPGLPPELATAIRDWLVRQTGSDAV